MPIVRAQIVLRAAYAAVFACLAGLYFAHYPIPGFFQRVLEFALAGGFLLLSAGLGAALAERWALAPWRWGTLESFLWGVGLGTPVLALGMLLLGAAGLFRPAWIGALTAAAAFAGGARSAQFLLAARSAWSRLSPPRSASGAALAALAAATTLLATLCALAPPTYYDSLVYHLALPAKYLQEGRVGFVPYNQYAHFPQYMEMIFAWFLAFGQDVSAQLLNVFLAALTGAALWLARRDTWGPGSPRWDVALFASAPCVLLLSSETYVEVPLAFWTTLALWAAARGLVVPDRRWWMWAGVAGGFATGVKYTGGITPALLFMAALLWPRPKAARERLKDAAALAVPAFLLFLPWLVKNYLLTGGNPIFPFLPRWFPAENVYLSEESSRGYFKVLDEYKGTSSLLVELFLMPLRLVSDSVSFGGGFDVTGDLGWALPLLLLPLAFRRFRSAPTGRQFLLAYVAAHIVLWASLRPVLRFLFPIFPAVCLLSGMGWAEASAGARPWLRKLGAGVFALFLASNANLFYLVERVRDPFPAAFGVEDRGHYLRRQIDSTRALEFVNAELPPESRLLFVGDQRGYYCRRPYLAPMALLPQPLKQWADESGSGDRLRAKLLELGFTHVFFHRREAERLKSYGVLDLTPAGKKAWDEMTARLPRAYDSEKVTVFSL